MCFLSLKIYIMPPESISLPAFADQAVVGFLFILKTDPHQKAVESYLPFFPLSLWSPRSLVLPSWN